MTLGLEGDRAALETQRAPRRQRAGIVVALVELGLFVGEDALAVFDSSDWADRGFCSRCGTHLFYRLKGAGEYHVPLGLFRDAVAPKFSFQVFIDEKPDVYAFADETRELTGAQVFEMYAPKS